MQTFQVGFYKDVFKNGELDFEDCEKWDGSCAEEVARIFSDHAFNCLDISELGCDDALDIDYENSWGEDNYSIVVKDKDGNISRFSVCVSISINFECNKIAV